MGNKENQPKINDRPFINSISIQNDQFDSKKCKNTKMSQLKSNFLRYCKRFIIFITNGEKWTLYHLLVFFLTFLSYVLLHSSRKTLSTVKSSLIEKWTSNSSDEESLFSDKKSAQSFLAILDGGFFAVYSIGLYIGGNLGDRFNANKILSIGMLLSAFMVFLFGTLPVWLNFHNKVFYGFTWIIGGFFQSFAWPCEVSIMGSWFGQNSRGTILGIWGTCAAIGNILGALISYYTIDDGYQIPFLCNAIVLMVGALVVFLFLPATPSTVGLAGVNGVKDMSNDKPPENEDKVKAIGFWKAWLVPGVFIYALAYACVKTVDYSFFSWLPYYLHDKFGWSESVADGFSIWYDCGGVISAIFAGFISDHMRSRAPIVVIMQILATATLIFYANSPGNVDLNSVLMGLMGFFIGGPSNLITTAVCADLGQKVQDSVKALSTIAGIIDGTGSVGASLGQVLLPHIQTKFSWLVVFYIFTSLMFLSAICLLPLLWKEIIDRYNRRRITNNDIEFAQVDNVIVSF